MSEPTTIGQERQAVCTWCGAVVRQVWTKYDFCADGYWNQEDHACGFVSARMGRWIERHATDHSLVAAGGAAGIMYDQDGNLRRSKAPKAD